MIGRLPRATLLVLLLTAAPAAGQESVFNLPGFGLPGTGESMRARALGGAGSALPGEEFSLENPSLMTGFGRAGFTLSLFGQRSQVEDAERSADVEDVVFPMGQVVVPAWTRTAVGVGIHQFIDFDAGLESEIEFEGDTLPATLDVEGGVAVLGPAVAFALDGRTSLGAALDVYVGSREIVRSVQTRDQAGNTFTTSDTLGRDFRALGVTVGANRVLGRAARVAVAYRLRPTVTSAVTTSSGEGLVGREAELDLPDELIVGVSAPVSRRLTAAASLRAAGWGGLGGEELAQGTFEDLLEVGGGLEFTPASEAAWIFGPSSPIRVGGRWRRLPIQLDGESVEEWSASVGYGRRFGVRSQLDIVLEAGRRGSIDEHGIAETFLRIGVGLGLFEQWRRDAPEGSGD